MEGELAALTLAEKHRAALEQSLKVEETTEIETELLAREMREMGLDDKDIEHAIRSVAQDLAHDALEWPANNQ